MQQKIKKILIFLFITSVCFAFVFKWDNTVSGKSVSELFSLSADVSLAKSYKIDSEYQKDSRSGVRLSSSKSNARIDLSRSITGGFEMDFRVFSQNALNNESLNSSNYSPSADLKTLSIYFTEKNVNDN